MAEETRISDPEPPAGDGAAEAQTRPVVPSGAEGRPAPAPSTDGAAAAQDIASAEAVTHEGEAGDIAQSAEDHLLAGPEQATPAIEGVLQDQPQSAEPSESFEPSPSLEPVAAAVEDGAQPVSEEDQPREIVFEDVPAALEDAPAAPAEPTPEVSEPDARDAEHDLQAALPEPPEESASVEPKNVLQPAAPLETEARDRVPAALQESLPGHDAGARTSELDEPALLREDPVEVAPNPASMRDESLSAPSEETQDSPVPAADGSVLAAEGTSAFHEAAEPETVPPSEDAIWSREEDHAPQPPPEAQAAPHHTDAERPVEAGGELVLWRHQEAAEEPPSAVEPQPSPAGVPHAAAPAAAAVLQPGAGTTASSPAADLGFFRYLRLAVRAAVYGLIGYCLLVIVLLAVYRWVDPPFSNLMLTQRLMGWQVEQKWVPLTRISPNLVQAVILSEDGGFCRHQGVDWVAIEEAIEESRGGSTITMQVVKNLFLWSSRSYIRKAIEIPLALFMEMLWPKQRILEVYLNIAEWGDGVFGAEAAAQHHFRKRAAQLSAQEAALLAVSLPNPIERQAGDPGAQTRRLASNLMLRMKAIRTSMTCVRSARFAW